MRLSMLILLLLTGYFVGWFGCKQFMQEPNAFVCKARGYDAVLYTITVPIYTTATEEQRARRCKQLIILFADPLPELP